MSEDIATAPTQVTKKAPSGLSFALDFGPLLLFFLTNHFLSSKADPAKGPIVGTAVFMVAIIVAIFISKWKLGKVSTMMWISAILVLGFGSITLWLGDPSFIQRKPTYIYLLFGGILIGGYVRGKPLLKYLLEYAFEGVDQTGWLKLSRNWGLFFFTMAAANEVMRAILSFDTWLTLKVWGMTALTFIFAMANTPMLLKHGLTLGEDDKNPA